MNKWYLTDQVYFRFGLLWKHASKFVEIDYTAHRTSIGWHTEEVHLPKWGGKNISFRVIWSQGRHLIVP